MKIHFAVEDPSGWPKRISTLCGIHGTDEGCYEFTADGTENRLDYTTDLKEMNCLRCRRVRKAQLSTQEI